MHRMIYFGPPGTGKTTTLLTLLEQELRAGVPMERIAFLTFTRRAKREAVERVEQVLGIKPKDLIYFRTIHSMAFHSLHLRDGDVLGKKHLDEFGKGMGLTFGNSGVSELAAEGLSSQQEGDQMLALDNLARLRGTNLKKTWNDSRSSLEWPKVQHFKASYDAYKKEKALLDFTDVLAEFAKQGLRIPVDVAFIDEAQDLSALQWYAALQAVEGAQRQYVAGDDDQCQPAGTMVRTPDGATAIEDLRDGDPVVTFDRNGSYTVGKKNSFYRVKTSNHLYYGHTYRFTIGRNSTVTTDTHLCLCKFNEEAKQQKVVYLMQRGKNWRIGQTQLCRIDGVVLLGHKLRLEKADAIWILKVCETASEAHYYEQWYALKFGLPQLCFVYHGGATILTQKQLNAIHASADTIPLAMKCLHAFGLRSDKPFWTLERSKSKRGGSSIFTIEACNVLPIVMSMMVYADLSWHPVRVTRYPMQRSRVYSLDVPKHHTYFADGIYTHNCIYRWAGADVNMFMKLPGERQVLAHSYRLPVTVHKLAQRIIGKVKTRVVKRFNSRDAEGSVKVHPTFDSLKVAPAEEWLWLVRNRYLLQPLRDHLERNSIVYSQHGSSSILESEREVIYDWERLRSGKAVAVHRIRDVYSKLKTKTQIQHGFKLLPGIEEDAKLLMVELNEYHGLLASGTWFEVFKEIPDWRRAYYRALLRTHGTLKLPVQVQLETIHGAKGAQANNVALFLEQSRRVWDESQDNPDDEHRVWYVGATRARENLHIVQAGNRWGYMMPGVSA